LDIIYIDTAVVVQVREEAAAIEKTRNRDLYLPMRQGPPCSLDGTKHNRQQQEDCTNHCEAKI